MKRFMLWLFISLSAFFALSSCSLNRSSEPEKTVGALRKDGGFIYSEEVPWGTGFAEAKEIYASPKLDPESDQYEAWRLSESSRFNRQTMIPDLNGGLYGLNWRVELNFDETGLYLASFYTYPDDFSQEIDPVLSDLYRQCGDGSMTEEELKGYLSDFSGKTLQCYWPAEDGSYLHLYISSKTSGTPAYTVALSVCPDERLTPVSECKEKAVPTSLPNF